MSDQGVQERLTVPIHPAVQCWLRLNANSFVPGEVTLLKETKKSAVYRLDGAGPGDGSAVIAKRCSRETARFESLIYREILSRLPLEALRCYGYLAEDSDGFGWLFLEDGGKSRVEDQVENFRTAVALWLGVLHASASCIARRIPLPDRGPDYYLRILQSARTAIYKRLDRPDLEVEGQFALGRLWDFLAALEQNWDRVAEWCEGLPWTLVHGDFQTKNMLTRSTPSGVALFPLDWEHAGWGPPAADLEGIDCASYWFAVRERWPGAEFCMVERQARCGALLKLLAAVGWETERLVSGSLQKAVRRLQIYAPRLSTSALAMGLRL